MKNLRVATTLAVEVCKEQWKNKFFQLIIIFCGVMIYGSLLLGAMAVEQEGRVLFNFGLGFIEFAAAAAVVFGCSSSVIK
ncbi:MAG: hypothetical protein NTW04_02605, partial [Elusimicrobia bacterium]|nr:hypothetical protein [Elusimicrobiota bacterium]